MALHLPKLSQK